MIVLEEVPFPSLLATNVNFRLSFCLNFLFLLPGPARKTLPNWQSGEKLQRKTLALASRFWFPCHNLQAANMFNSCTMSAALSSSLGLGLATFRQGAVLLDKSQLPEKFSAAECSPGIFRNAPRKIVDSWRSLAWVALAPLGPPVKY